MHSISIAFFQQPLKQKPRKTSKLRIAIPCEGIHVWPMDFLTNGQQCGNHLQVTTLRTMSTYNSFEDEALVDITNAKYRNLVAWLNLMPLMLVMSAERFYIDAARQRQNSRKQTQTHFLPWKYWVLIHISPICCNFCITKSRKAFFIAMLHALSCRYIVCWFSILPSIVIWWIELCQLLTFVHM